MFITAAISMSRVLKPFKPKTIVVDEASQMAEIASMTVVGNFFPRVQMVILVADLHQIIFSWHLLATTNLPEIDNEV